MEWNIPGIFRAWQPRMVFVSASSSAALLSGEILGRRPPPPLPSPPRERIGCCFLCPAALRDQAGPGASPPSSPEPCCAVEGSDGGGEDKIRPYNGGCRPAAPEGALVAPRCLLMSKWFVFPSFLLSGSSVGCYFG